jgi:vacuolar-type H+-ATPase subunit C/Vma6
VPTKKFNLTDETVEAIVTAPDFDSAHKITLKTHYAHFFPKAQSPDTTMANAEKALSKTLFLLAKETRFTEIFNIGAILAFLTQKESEVHNLTTISLGVEAGLKSEDIQQSLVI